ncbi:methyltransferase family protein [Hoeflea poritis]|uniref:Isoprenylcysteine carboxylmethyltransferase family protein n=1 Tax=Hoeflea poritis TaxID=2993659 RepID=A0ABT4VUS1_9HYPH|nr:isoprenylcysteine carboxylmethyltransferase family protein [Hoeflea poritis]MDA4847777.1 isoprenylcysteine carboxylmethyltransferase family protein [Hoeflea poritis]
MSAYRAKPSNVPWPPIIAAAALLLSILAGRVFALPLPDTAFLRMIGVLFLLAAIAVDIWSITTLRAARTTIMPTRKSTCLVTAGPYGLSRNPIYCGYVLFLIALGLILANAWFVVFAAATAYGIQRFAIEREELHLLAVFGAEYEAYCRRVRRWV